MRWNLDDLPVFTAIIEHQSVTAAAAALNLSKSTVSKTLTRLEEALGVRLLERNSRRLRITGEGEAFYRQASLILEQAQETDAIMAGMVSEPHGKLTVALPIAFAREFVAPQLGVFQQQFPHLELELIITSHPVDIIRDQIDLAVVVGALHDSELVARPLYQSRLLWVTSPAYLARQPLGSTPADLLTHIRICEKRYALARFPVRMGDLRQELNLSQGIIQVNDPLAVREAVLHGLGVSPLPDQYCKRHLQSGQLVQVFEQISFEASASRLSVIYPGRRRLASKTRIFLDFLLAICREI